MKRFQLAGLSGVLVSFAIISGGYASVAAAAMGDSEATTMAVSYTHLTLPTTPYV